MREVYVLVEKKKGLGIKILFVVSLFITMVGIIGTFAGGFVVAFALAIIFGFISWILSRYCVEYEYSYFDGEVRFVKIKNKSRRKKIGVYTMDEVTMIAPEMDRSVYEQVNNPNIKPKDLTTKEEGAKIYAMIAKGETGVEVIKFEPDEAFLDAIAHKYPMKVKK